MAERPVPGNVDPFLGQKDTPQATPQTEEPTKVIEDELRGIRAELGYDFEVVG
jgi:hypothetical protein